MHGGRFVHETTFEFEYGSSERARTVARSILPERSDLADARSRTSVNADGTSVRMRVEAADLVALRAACNTWLSLVGVSERCASIGDRIGDR